MGTTALRQVLRSLCVDSHWTYAVFWKLRHENLMILTWEDGYSNCDNPREVAEHNYCSNESDTYSSEFKTILSNDSSGGYTIGLVVADMSRLQYAMGEGVVGKAASTGNHYWFSFNNLFNDEMNPNSVLECPEEWLIQFAFGIKTILLVPLSPLNGVLQLGSYEEVAEDTETVAYLKGRLATLHGTVLHCSPFSVKNESQFSSSSSMLYSPTKCPAAPSFMKCEYSTYLETVKQEENDSMAPAEFLPPFNLHDASMHAGEDTVGAFGCDSEVAADASLIALTDISLEGELINNNQLEIIESKLLELSCLVQEFKTYSESYDYNFQVFGDSFGEIDIPPAIDTVEQAKCIGEFNNKNVITSLGFPRDSELHKALGPALWAETEELVGDSRFFLGDFAAVSSRTFNCPGDGSEHPLDAVVSNAFTGLDHNFSGTADTETLELSTSRYLELSPSVWPRSQFVGCALPGDESSLWTSTNTPSNLMNTNNIDMKQQQQQGQTNTTKSRCGQRRKKAKPGKSKKPRPRDRQLIQDRVKHLREMIPNGGKCSIDSLLDQTIKHMHHLKSAAAQAEKLRQPAFQKISASTDAESTKTRTGEQIGTTWAYEFGNSLQPCPIIVEEIACPGHLRIEIACNEHSLFLEIAQVIRNLNLTIVRAVMDNSTELTWARFIVEISKGFQRLEIFWPLMQLLQSRRGRSPVKNDIF